MIWQQYADRECLYDLSWLKKIPTSARKKFREKKKIVGKFGITNCELQKNL